MSEEKNTETKQKKPHVVNIVVFVVFGCVILGFCVAGGDKKNAGVTENVSAKKVEVAKSNNENTSTDLPTSALSKQDMITNPLFMGAARNKMRIVQNGTKTATLGTMLVVEVPSEELKTVTGKQLHDFWQYGLNDEFLFVSIIETDEHLRNYTGNGMVLNKGGTSARYGKIHTDVQNYVDFGMVLAPARTFFFIGDDEEILFQYFDETDNEDEPLRIFKAADFIFSN